MPLHLTEAEVADLVAKGAVLGPPVRLPPPPAEDGSYAPGPYPAAPARRDRKGRHPLVDPGFEPPATFLIPLVVYAGENSGSDDERNSRHVRNGRAGHERKAVSRVLGRHLSALAPLADVVHDRGGKLSVVLTRLGPGTMDYTNLVPSLKWVQDIVALFFGVDDSPRAPARWRFEQERSARYGVRIQLSTEGGVA